MTAAATATGIYVYGVVHADELPAVSAEGVAGRPVELLQHEGLAALVSRLPGEFRVKRLDLTRHLQVLEEAFGETTVVPCPFGTVLLSEGDVESALLSERRDELRDALRRLNGKVQLNVKASYDEEQVMRELVEGSPEVLRLREASRRLGDAGHFERMRLGELVAAMLDERRARDAERIVSHISEAADDVAIDQPGELEALKGSFLVSRKRLDKFDARLEEVAAMLQPTLVVEVIGPLPPTAFAGAG